jgi:hypothetical protein
MRSEKKKTEARGRPPGGQNVNKRLLEKGVKKVNEAWRNYFDAAHTFVDRGTFAEAPEQATAIDLVTQESLAHEDWFEKVETILTQVELADTPNQCWSQSSSNPAWDRRRHRGHG